MKKFYYMIRENLSYIPFIINVFIKNLTLKRHCFVEKIHYGSHPKQQSVIVTPKRGVTKKHTICFIHGGGWSKGSAGLFRFVGGFFAKFGYATVICGYRLVPEAHYPTLVDDVVESIKMGMSEKKSKKLILVGQSAGAHLATLITFKDLLEDYMVSGVVSISGPINFSVCTRRVSKTLIKRFMQNETNYHEADPMQYISTNKPILCMQGAHDPIIEVENSTSFIKQATNQKNEIVIIKNGLHANLVRMFWFKMQEYQLLIDWVNQFENEKQD